MPGIPELPIPDSLLASGESPQGAEVFAFWSDAAKRIRSDETDRTEELQRLLAKGMSWYLLHDQAGPGQMDEKAREMFVAVMQVAEAITFRQRTKLMKRVLDQLGEKDREILTRFFVKRKAKIGFARRCL